MKYITSPLFFITIIFAQWSTNPANPQLLGSGVQAQLASTSDGGVYDGTFYGECPNQGVIMAQDGVATFRATGMGTFTADGGSKFRGACYFQSSAPSLSSLNGICCVYHFDADAKGNTTWDIWDWK